MHTGKMMSFPLGGKGLNRPALASFAFAKSPRERRKGKTRLGFCCTPEIRPLLIPLPYLHKRCPSNPACASCHRRSKPWLDSRPARSLSSCPAAATRRSVWPARAASPATARACCRRNSSQTGCRVGLETSAGWAWIGPWTSWGCCSRGGRSPRPWPRARERGKTTWITSKKPTNTLRLFSRLFSEGLSNFWSLSSLSSVLLILVD